jgi:DNA end-binding protein Ku
MMITLRYANELRKEKEFDFPPMSLKSAGVTAKELELAQKLIEDMTGEWKPEEFEDTYNEDLLQRIEEKVKRGETKVLTKPEAEAGEGRSAQVIDLMELLKRSIDKTGARAAPERGAKRTAANADEEEGPPRAATRARKSSAAHKATAERKPAARRKRA